MEVGRMLLDEEQFMLESKWAIFEICMEDGEYDKAWRILDCTPEMEGTTEEIEEGYRKLVESLKREGIWRED